ncbi:HypC/HybG/HupF family hydrogenase formation chaperone [Salipiger aestuarii]|uniref:HypC/HybG/HupF family hydrogenase formation chaperone n=1 Tax=Salipiger aestuarii TaxID=568098 RepID=UPI00123B9090|nr:HypC/HybG/HupF family hydrogenase formation chaperone [Salipiger aestuarii]KAA8616239.1 hydrogenase [Salipiger aestuarii]
MCVGIPMRLLGIDGIAGSATGDEGDALIDLSLTPDAKVGDWVLTHLGHAREVISAQEAALIVKALCGLRAVMNGAGVGDAFADIENRAPQLPPHLADALAAGKATG